MYYNYNSKRSRKQLTRQAIIVAFAVLSTFFSLLIPFYMAGLTSLGH